MSRDIDSGKKSDESGTNVNTSFPVKIVAKHFSRQELREHSSLQH
jgi:hypothetical protein